MINVKHILFALPLFLVGCGGGGSEAPSPTPEPEVSPPVTPPPANSAPQATDDFAVSEDNNTVSIEVLANDSDQDGDDLSIQSILNEPLNGTVSIEDDVIVYTPNSFYAGEDSFSYQISDGELTSEANVTLQVTQSITVNGIVTDSPVSGATVTANLSSGQFTAVADEQGAYSLDLVLSNLTDVVTVNAVGSEENNQAAVELVSFLGNTQELLDSGSEQRVVGADTLFATNITNVSTATLLLVQEANAGTLPSTLDAFSSIMESVNAQALLELAAFINILVDNPNFVVPEGQTSLSIFQSEEGQTIRVAIDTYLASVGALDEENSPSSVYLEAESEAIDTIVQSSSLLPSFDIEDVRQSNLVATFGNVFPGFLPETGSVYQLNSNGDGLFHSEFDSGRGINSSHFSFPITWQLAQGRINVNFSEDNEVALPAGGAGLSVEEIRAMFGEEAMQAAVEFLESINSDSGTIITVTFFERPLSAQIVPINIGDTVAQVRVITRLQVLGELRLGFGSDESNPIFEALELSMESEDINLYLSPESVLSDGGAESLVGRWALPIEYTYTPVIDGVTFSSSLTDILHDILTLNANGTANGQLSEQAFSWNLSSSGEIELNSDGRQYSILPIIDNGIEYLAQVTQRVGNAVEDVVVTRIAKFDTDFVFSEENVVSELPLIQADFADVGFDASIWPNGQLDPRFILGEHQFEATGEANFFISSDTDEGLIFDIARTGTWTSNAEQFNFRYFIESSGFSDDNQWFPIGVNERGWLYVFQLRNNFLEPFGEVDGRFDENDFPFVVFEPQIEIIIPIDLSTYEEEYERSVLMGTVPPLP